MKNIIINRFKHHQKLIQIIRNIFHQERDLVKPAFLENDFSEFEPLDLTETEKNIFRKLHHLSEMNNCEYIAYLYSDGSVVYRTSGVYDGVEIKESLIQPGVHLYHSHTSDSQFSFSDMEQLFRSEVEEIGVICKNEDVYLLSVGNGYLPPFNEFRHLGKDEDFRKEIVADVISMYPDIYFLGINENSYLVHRELVYRIIRMFGWTVKGGKING